MVPYMVPIKYELG